MNDSTVNQSEFDGNPLITFALFAYNQEMFIREAIVGALSQTYSPLEIIISDDCSTDKTYEIMVDMVSEYRGPHNIVLNKNENNLGIASHVNKVISLAKGLLIIAAAGDDISFPTRTSELTELWVKNGRFSGIVYSQYEPIDNEGNSLNVDCLCKDVSDLTIEEFASRFNPGIVGATQAWTKDLFIKFGPLPHDLYCEDAVFVFRAKLYGEILFLDRVLLKYRFHQSSLSNNCSLSYKNMLLHHKRSVDVFNVFISDILNGGVDHRISSSTRESLLSVIYGKIKQAELEIKLSEGTLKERIFFAFEASKHKAIKKLLRNIFIALTPELYCLLHDNRYLFNTLKLFIYRL